MQSSFGNASQVWPLANSGEQVSHSYEPLHAPPKRIDTVGRSLYRQWQLISDDEFLGSGHNKRAHWQILLPFLAVVSLAGDFFLGQIENCHWVIWLDIFFLVISTLLGFLPARKIYSDMIIIIAYSVYMWVFVFSTYQLDCVEFVVCFFMFVLGLHPCAILAFGTNCCIIRCFRHEFLVGILSMAGCIGVAMVAWYASLKEAEVFRELEAKKTVVERLLDYASNGFCTIDPANSKVQTASPQLQSTLGEDSLVGKTLTNFISMGECKAFDSLSKCALTGEEVKPFLITCQAADGPSAVSTFDAKVIPYASSPDSVSLCFQVLGEIRTVADNAAPERTYIPSKTQSSSLNYSTSDIEDKTPPSDVSWNISQRSKSSLRRGGGSPEKVRFADMGVQTTPDTYPGSSSRPPKLPPSTRDDDNRSVSSASSASSTGNVSRSKRWRRSSNSRVQVLHVSGDMRPLLSQHRLTAANSCVQSMLWLIKHWNLPKSPTACCPLHSSAELVMKLVETSRNEPCDPLWSPYTDWQCSACSGMNSDTSSKCVLCGAQGPEIQATATENTEGSQASSVTVSMS